MIIFVCLVQLCRKLFIFDFIFLARILKLLSQFSISTRLSAFLLAISVLSALSSLLHHCLVIKGPLNSLRQTYLNISKKKISSKSFLCWNIPWASELLFATHHTKEMIRFDSTIVKLLNAFVSTSSMDNHNQPQNHTWKLGLLEQNWFIFKWALSMFSLFVIVMPGPGLRLRWQYSLTQLPEHLTAQIFSHWPPSPRVSSH